MPEPSDLAAAINASLNYTCWAVYARADAPPAQPPTSLSGWADAVAANDITVRGFYDLPAMRADADLMVWFHGPGPEHLQPGAARLRRQARARKKIAGTPDRPRLVVTRSSRHILAQVIDDTRGMTLASASSMEADDRSTDGDKSAKAKAVGKLVADRAKQAGIENVVFDRAGNKYHGRVAALADSAREAGLGF